MKNSYNLADLRKWEDATSSITAPIRFGVFGDPIEHSLSPQLQNAALAECGIEARYARFCITTEELREALELAQSHGFGGVNLTIPHKVRAQMHLDIMDESALLAGAVNTISFATGEAAGSNTDGSGFVDAIAEIWPDLDLVRTPILLLGVGGAGRAIAAECARVGCEQLTLFNRNADVALELSVELAARFPRCAIQVTASAASAAKSAKLIVNATSVGLRATDTPLIPREEFNSSHFVYDTIYRPAATTLIAEARAAGATTANGLSMLLHQGTRAFEIWFSRPAPVEVMRRALESAAKLR